jgi:hypothetical protein
MKSVFQAFTLSFVILVSGCGKKETSNTVASSEGKPVGIYLVYKADADDYQVIEVDETLKSKVVPEYRTNFEFEIEFLDETRAMVAMDRYSAKKAEVIQNPDHLRILVDNTVVTMLRVSALSFLPEELEGKWKLPDSSVIEFKEPGIVVTSNSEDPIVKLADGRFCYVEGHGFYFMDWERTGSEVTLNLSNHRGKEQSVAATLQ